MFCGLCAPVFASIIVIVIVIVSFGVFGTVTITIVIVIVIKYISASSYRNLSGFDIQR